jgi:hypothetical protein
LNFEPADYGSTRALPSMDCTEMMSHNVVTSRSGMMSRSEAQVCDPVCEICRMLEWKIKDD